MTWIQFPDRLYLVSSHLVQAVLLELDYLKLEVCPLPVLVKLDSAGDPVDVRHLHVVDQRVAVLPRGLGRAAEGRHGDHLHTHPGHCWSLELSTGLRETSQLYHSSDLGHVEVREGGGEQRDGVIQQRRVRLNSSGNGELHVTRDT